ncbi:hypothetical protein HK22_04230 [Gluconobacter sp. DsW_056]|nr:hypothetical protein HK22_04230 [Gluconobacter sp. DsW_056]
MDVEMTQKIAAASQIILVNGTLLLENMRLKVINRICADAFSGHKKTDLNRSTRFYRFTGLFRSGFNNEPASPWRNSYNASATEPHHRFSHQSSRDTENLAQIFLSEPFSWRDFRRKNGLYDPVLDDIAAGWLQRFFPGFHNSLYALPFPKGQARQ